MFSMNDVKKSLNAMGYSGKILFDDGDMDAAIVFESKKSNGDKILATLFVNDRGGDFDRTRDDVIDEQTNSAYVMYEFASGQAMHQDVETLNDLLTCFLTMARFKGTTEQELDAALGKAGLRIAAPSPVAKTPQTAAPKMESNRFTFKDILRALTEMGIQLTNLRPAGAIGRDTAELLDSDEDLYGGDLDDWEAGIVGGEVAWGKYGIKVACSVGLNKSSLRPGETVKDKRDLWKTSPHSVPLVTFGFGVYKIDNDEWHADGLGRAWNVAPVDGSSEPSTWEDDYMTSVYSQDESIYDPQSFNGFTLKNFMIAFMTFYGKDLTKKNLRGLEDELEELDIVSINNGY